MYCICVGECPKGIAWTDKAYATDLAHQEVTCSNAGKCNVDSGECECFDGFTGIACQRSKQHTHFITIRYYLNT